MKERKYRLIGTPLCDLSEDISCYEDCAGCEYFFDCLEEDNNRK